MKYVLYILLGIITLVVGFFIWFFVFLLQVPELKVSENVNESQKIQEIDQWFEQLHKARKFNGGVLIVKEGKPMLAKTYGYTSAQKNKKLENTSMFRLASVSKQFTAAGIMLLKEKGDIDYDDVVVKYIPGFPYSNVTIRHLMNHTSGVPDNYMQLAQEREDAIKILSNQKAVELVIAANQKVDFQPNEKYAYSNTNYILLARIIELVSHQSFEDFMKEKVFDPLQMNNTRVWNLLSDDQNFNHKTDGFEDFVGVVKKVTPSFIDGVAGDGAVFASINDFILWDAFWYQNDLISQENLKEAFKRPMLTSGDHSNYGFGWGIKDQNEMSHTGLWLAASTFIKRNTEKKICVVVLDNSANMYFDGVIDEIEAISW